MSKCFCLPSEMLSFTKVELGIITGPPGFSIICLGGILCHVSGM